MKYYNTKDKNLVIGSVVPDQHLMDHSWIALIDSKTKRCESITGLLFPLSGEYTLDNENILDKARSIEQALLYKHSGELLELVHECLNYRAMPEPIVRKGFDLIRKIESIDEPFQRLIKIPSTILKDI